MKKSLNQLLLRYDESLFKYYKLHVAPLPPPYQGRTQCRKRWRTCSHFQLTEQEVLTAYFMIYDVDILPSMSSSSTQFRQTELAPVNILQPSTEDHPQREKIKIPSINSEVEVDAVKGNAKVAKMGGKTYVLQCFLLYCAILIHFTPISIPWDLVFAFQVYNNQLLGYLAYYTFESVKSIRFVLHFARMSARITDAHDARHWWINVIHGF